MRYALSNLGRGIGVGLNKRLLSGIKEIPGRYQEAQHLFKEYEYLYDMTIPRAEFGGFDVDKTQRDWLSSGVAELDRFQVQHRTHPAVLIFEDFNSRNAYGERIMCDLRNDPNINYTEYCTTVGHYKNAAAFIKLFEILNDKQLDGKDEYIMQKLDYAREMAERNINYHGIASNFSNDLMAGPQLLGITETQNTFFTFMDYVIKANKLLALLCDNHDKGFCIRYDIVHSHYCDDAMVLYNLLQYMHKSQVLCYHLYDEGHKFSNEITQNPDVKSIRVSNNYQDVLDQIKCDIVVNKGINERRNTNGGERIIHPRLIKEFSGVFDFQVKLGGEGPIKLGGSAVDFEFECYYDEDVASLERLKSRKAPSIIFFVDDLLDVSTNNVLSSLYTNPEFSKYLFCPKVPLCKEVSDMITDVQKRVDEVDSINNPEEYQYVKSDLMFHKLLAQQSILYHGIDLPLASHKGLEIVMPNNQKNLFNFMREIVAVNKLIVILGSMSKDSLIAVLPTQMRSLVSNRMPEYLSDDNTKCYYLYGEDVVPDSETLMDDNVKSIEVAGGDSFVKVAEQIKSEVLNQDIQDIANKPSRDDGELCRKERSGDSILNY